MDQTPSFSDALNDYITLAECSCTQLSELSGISQASLSRYRSGARIPDASSDTLAKLAEGLAALLPAEHRAEKDEILAKLTEALAAQQAEKASELGFRLDALCSALGINMSAMAKSIDYDASFISRLRSGQRRPSDPQAFASSVAGYVLQTANEQTRKAISNLTDLPQEDLTGEGALTALASWLVGGGTTPTNPLDGFLEKLDEFDLNDFMTAIHFDQLKIPTVPFRLPTSKTYYQLEGMRQAELDFLMVTATARSAESVIMCSDMPMEDMAKDRDFSKKWMFGLAALMKRGIRLHVVHGVNRPMQELALGLESWIPLYMTGLVTPYYLKNHEPGVFERLDYVSGVASLKGENIQGHHSDGRYVLEKGSKEIAYQRKRMEAILSKAAPLMQIYRDSELDAFNAFKAAHEEELKGVDSSAFKNISIVVKPGRFAIIEKINEPAIRFVIHHPQMVNAIETFTPPVVLQ